MIDEKTYTEKPSAEPLRPKTEEELVAYIREMAAWPNSTTDAVEGYGRCVYAMSYAAVATFNYIASTLGVTGFQAGCADLDILTHTRGMKHGFLILNGNDVLYPQYDLVEKAREFVGQCRMSEDIRTEARRLLAEATNAAPAVAARWQEIADAGPMEAES